MWQELRGEEIVDDKIGKPDCFNLKEITKRSENGSISLPTVQRGFVWKPYQIENLWDSLLRGYPVGAFVLAEKADSKNQYELLDGQQRASAICLGFHDPLEPSKDYLKTSTDSIMVFIDLVKPSHETDNRKFIFRVITKSHPWGYRQKESQKTLEAEHIRKAMDCYGLQNENYNYLEEPLNVFWPYDAYEPIPIGLFIHAAINEKSGNELEATKELIESINKWKADKALTEDKKLKVMDRKGATEELYKIEDIYCAVKKMLSAQKIPLLFLNMQELYGIEEDNKSNTKKGLVVDPRQKFQAGSNTSENEDAGQNIIIERNIEDRSIDEVENLFIRLNSGGTPLRGEELNYSVLKSHISRELQNRIEHTCSGIFYPARFITMAFRLFNHFESESAQEKDSINMRIKPKQFQMKIRVEKKRDEFKKFIENSLINSNLIGRIKEILIYHEKTNPIGLPRFIINSLADESPEIMFMLLYRLLLKKDEIDSVMQKKVLGMLTLFSWFGKGEKQKDHSKLLQLIWPCVRDFDAERFWSKETIQRAMILDNDYEILTPFPSSKVLVTIGKKFSDGLDIRSWERPESWGLPEGDRFVHFIDKAFHNRNLILFAQRKLLFDCFGKIEEITLDDTNRAFDWDHISPDNAIRSKKKIHPALKKWYSSNGNFRAWPYSLNRKNQDESPAIKLIEEENFLSYSFCDNEWLTITPDDIKEKIRNNATIKKITGCILRRNIALCKEWYKVFGIDELIPPDYRSKKEIKELKELLVSIFYSRKWLPEPVKDDTNRFAYYLPVDDIDLYFSFNIELEALNEGGLYFGLRSKQKIPTHKIPAELEDKYFYEIENSFNYIGTWVTLVSISEYSVARLFRDFYVWLENFPNDEIRKLVLPTFSESIKTKYRDNVKT